VTDIREILRRLQLGEPDRRIARDLGISRNTVAHYGVLPTLSEPTFYQVRMNADTTS